MTENTKICHKTKGGNIITPEGVCFFVKYLHTAHENDKGKLKHNLELCFPPEADLKLLKNEIGRVAMENCDNDKAAARKHVEKRFIDPNNKPDGGKPAGDKFEGWVLIRASSDYCPDFIAPNGQRMTVDEFKRTANSGDFIRASIQPYWKDMGKSKGVFLGLQNVQFIRKGETIGFVKPDGEGEFGSVSGAEKTSKKSASKGSDVESLFEDDEE